MIDGNGIQPTLLRLRRQRQLSFNQAGINTTYACDLACIGCSRGCFIKPPFAPDLTPDRLRAVFADFDRLGLAPQRINLTGGEPTQNPRLGELANIAVAWAAQHGSHVGILSNHHSERALQVIAEIQGRHPAVTSRTGTKTHSVRFAGPRQSLFVSPRDFGPGSPVFGNWATASRRPPIGMAWTRKRRTAPQ